MLCSIIFFICNLQDLLGCSSTGGTAGTDPSPGVRSVPGLCEHEQGLLSPAKARTTDFLAIYLRGSHSTGYSPLCWRTFPVTASVCFFLNVCAFKLSVAIHHMKWGRGRCLPRKEAETRRTKLTKSGSATSALDGFYAFWLSCGVYYLEGKFANWLSTGSQPCCSFLRNCPF